MTNIKIVTKLLLGKRYVSIMIRMSERTTTFWPLPGGCKLEVLHKILGKIADEPTVDEMIRWIAETFGESPGWVSGSVRAVIVYSGLAVFEGERIRLTSRGLEFLKSKNPEVVLKAFLERIWGIREIILWLNQENLSIKEIYMKCVDLGVRWRAGSQVRFRIMWLQSLGCIEKSMGKYSLTAYGKNVAEELIRMGLLPEPPRIKTSASAKVSELIQVEYHLPASNQFEAQAETTILNHNKIRDMIYEIGKFRGMISETEYPIDNLRLDVAWKKIKGGNPSHAFEVQISGNFFEALTKLKHAWDKWNSKPFLITTEKYEEEAKKFLEGTFHEIEHVAKIVNWKKIKELYDVEKKAKDLRDEIGVV
ncbi:MAG: hypothetical protein H5T50_06480 [Nitrososphaeria archaeon]|nr:hypothetical protein [Nitrososphaeria archaeon]